MELCDYRAGGEECVLEWGVGGRGCGDPGQSVSVWNCVTIGLVVRSVCWSGEKVLAGTKSSEVYEVSVQDQTHPLLLVSGHAEGELWALATHPAQNIFATASDDKTIRYCEVLFNP